MSRKNLRAVFFDAGQTLLRVRSSVGAVYGEVAEEHGIAVDPRELEQRFRTAWGRSAVRCRERGHRSSDEILRAEWLEIVRETFPMELPAAKLQPLFEDLYGRFSSGGAWHLVPGAHETLATLRDLGVRLGVVSNWDSRLPRLLEELGVLSAFDFLVVSYEVGFEKPHPAMFHRALELAGVGPGQALHVGDSWEADIEPARELGIRTLWLAPAGERERRTEYDGELAFEHLPNPPGDFWGDFVPDGAGRGSGGIRS